MKSSYVVMMAVLLSSVSFISSAAPQFPRLQKRFNAADTNHDGKLTKQEAQAGMPRVAEHFDQIDSAKKGTITLEQLKSFMEAQRKGA